MKDNMKWLLDMIKKNKGSDELAAMASYLVTPKKETEVKRFHSIREVLRRWGVRYVNIVVSPNFGNPSCKIKGLNLDGAAPRSLLSAFHINGSIEQIAQTSINVFNKKENKVEFDYIKFEIQRERDGFMHEIAVFNLRDTSLTLFLNYFNIETE